MFNSPDPNTKRLYRWGGISGIALSLSYVVITALYVMGGTLPEGAEEWLQHLAAHTQDWWAILGLSVFTDFLFLPLAWALYAVLKDVARDAMVVGTGFLVLFVILDLAITWPNFSVLITLSGKYLEAVDDTQRLALIAAASYPVEVLSSSLFAVYAILVPSLGILFIGWVMRKGIFNKVAAYVGVITGILGAISVVGPFIVHALGMLAVPTSILTTVWVLVVGLKLLKLGR